MYSWVRLSHILEWSKGHADGSGFENIRVTNLSTDTRSVKNDEVFVALRGDKFDGHNFIAEAVKKGACAVMAERKVETSVPVIVVKDSIKAMAYVGQAIREQFKGTVLGVTGSAGKSSTKETIATLLGANTVKSPASFNNLQGVSRTMCLVEDSTKNLVLEMGMNAFFEIKELCEHFQPEIGLITNIGDAHIGKLGGQEGIFKAKKELFDYLAAAGKKTKGVALNLDDRFVKRAYDETLKGKTRVLTYSAEGLPADVTINEKKISSENGELSLTMTVQGERLDCRLPLFGLHHAQNIAAGLAAALLVGKTLAELKPRFQEIRPAYHRGEMFALPSGRTLIDESYNSNPTALVSSLQSLAKIDAGKHRLLVLGEMRELGEFAERLHRKAGETLGNLCAEKKIPFTLVAVGGGVTPLIDGVRAILPNADCHQIKTVDEAIAEYPGWKFDILFVKGSRGIALDRLVGHVLKTKS